VILWNRDEFGIRPSSPRMVITQVASQRSSISLEEKLVYRFDLVIGLIRTAIPHPGLPLPVVSLIWRAGNL
jgi:hypothetical protein